MLRIIAEIFSHGSAGIWSKVKHGRRVGWAGSYNDCLIHNTFALKTLLQGCNLGQFLPDSDIYIYDASFLPGLVNHGIDGNCRFTSLTVTNDQLTLTPTNWHN